MTTYRPETIPPENRRTKPGTVHSRQTVDHTEASHDAMKQIATAVPCNNAEAVRRALLLVSPESLRIAEVLAKRWGMSPREALEQALARAGRGA